jgi:hypothetical protein
MSDSNASMPETIGTVVTTRPAERFRQYAVTRAMESIGTRGIEVMDSQVDNILNTAEKDGVTEKELWDADAGGTVQARDVPGLEVEIRDLDFVTSDRDDIENNKGYYASMGATVLGGPEDVLTQRGLELGMDIVLQTGADLIIAKVRAFQSQGWLPMKAVVTAIRTGSGNDVLKLRPLPKRVK